MTTDELFGRHARPLLVAGGDVSLVEDQEIQVPAWESLVGGDLGGHRPCGRIDKHFSRLGHPLKQQSRTTGAILSDDNLILSKISDGSSGGIHHADVHADQVDAGAEGQLRLREDAS